MSTIPEEHDIEIISLIEKLRPAPERYPSDAVTGKAKFLAEAQTYPLPVTQRLNGHPKDWKAVFSRKMQPRLAVIPILMVIFLLVFMGTGVTVFAAQSSLPDQPLYGVKLASEDVRTSLSTNNQSRIELAMDFADLRLQEVLQLAAEGKPIPTTILARMENHIDLALLTAAGLDDQQLLMQLLTIQSRLKLEDEKRIQLEANSRYNSTVENVQAILLSRLQLVKIGLSDPAAFRQYMQSEQHRSDGQPAATASPLPTDTLTPEPTRAMPTHSATNQMAQPTQGPAWQATGTHWPEITPWSPSTQQPGWHNGSTPVPTNQWNNHNDCQDCGGWNGGSGGHDGGGSGGHDGGSGGGHP